MKKRTYRRPSQTGPRRRTGSERDGGTSRLGNQMSVALLLCVFFIAATVTGGSTAEKIRLRTAEIIGKNALENFQKQDSIGENISEFVRCMFTSDGEKNETGGDEISEDQPEEKEETSAAGDTSASVNGSSDVEDDAKTQEPPPE